VRFIATATIGYDHIDADFCKKSGIEWTNAPGCNSKSVEQYIASVLLIMSRKQGFSLKDKTIGIVGVGNVGSKVARVCELMGMRVLLNDPPRARAEGKRGFVELDEILEDSDIITLHTPLNMEGADKTFHLADENFLLKARKSPILINSCRGEVVDTASLTDALRSGTISDTVIDCWENEPEINAVLLELSALATPHIAGYSKDGKANGTSMSVQSISKFFNLGADNWQCKNVELPESTEIRIEGAGKTEQQIFEEAILATYDIREDDKRLRDSVDTFEKQRGDYPVRREFTSYTIYAENISDNTIDKLKAMGFSLKFKIN
jgi:erythronate-4-phosphate dehydrogenase